MALPTVHFDQVAAGTNSSTIQNVMTRLQAVMLAATWDLLYADATAIGGGSSGNPAWDATPTNNTSAGKTIWRMPANDHSRQWYVQVEVGWGSNTGNFHRFIVTVGTGFDGVDALTGAGSTITYETGGSASTGLEAIMAASEDGFALFHTSNSQLTARWILVERARDLNGTVNDDLIVCGYASATTAGYFPNVTPNHGSVRYRASDGLQYAGAPYFALAAVNNAQGMSTLATGSTTSADGETNVPVGPVPMSGGIAGIPRLAMMLNANDVVINTDHPVLVDGQVRLYRVQSGTLPSSGYALAVARE